MRNGSLTIEREEALLDLIDDPSPWVRTQLIDEFIRMGPQGFDFLNTIAKRPNRLLSWHARWFLSELDKDNPISEFIKFIQSERYELESGSLRIANRSLATGDVCKSLDQIAFRCRQLLIEPASPRDKLLVINRILFHEMEFRGNREDYTNPKNSFLPEILKQKTGLPISLSILYILVAGRLGLDLEGVAIPGHFIVGCYETPQALFIDPFDSGKLWTGEELLQNNGTIGFITDPSVLVPTTIREILCRSCRNLVSHYNQAGQADFAQTFQRFVSEFQTVDRNHNGF